jgi:hypothetical protein
MLLRVDYDSIDVLNEAAALCKRLFASVSATLLCHKR